MSKKNDWQTRLCKLAQRLHTVWGNWWFEFNQDIVTTDRHGYRVMAGIHLMSLRQLRKLRFHPDGTSFGYDKGAPRARDTYGTLIVAAKGAGKTVLLFNLLAKRLRLVGIDRSLSSILFDPKSGEVVELISHLTGALPHEADFPGYIAHPFDRRSGLQLLSFDITNPSVISDSARLIIVPDQDNFFQMTAILVFEIAGRTGLRLAAANGPIPHLTLAVWIRIAYTLLSSEYTPEKIKRFLMLAGVSDTDRQKILTLRDPSQRATELRLEILKTLNTALSRYELLAALGENKMEEWKVPGYSVKQCIDEGKLLILGTDWECRIQIAAINSIAFSTAISYILSLADSSQRRCYLVIDEALDIIQNISDDLIAALDVGRGKGLSPIITILSTEGLESVLKSNSKALHFLGSFGNYLVGLASSATAKTVVDKIVPPYSAMTQVTKVGGEVETISFDIEELPPIAASELASFPPASRQDGSHWFVYLRGRSAHTYHLKEKEVNKTSPQPNDHTKDVRGYDPMTKEEIAEFSKLRDWTKKEKQKLGLN